MTSHAHAHAPISASRTSVVLPLFVLVFSLFLLDLQYGSFTINIGNVALFIGSVLAGLMAYSRTRFERASIKLTTYDWLYAIYLIYGAASAWWAPSFQETIVGVVYLTAFWIATLFVTRADVLLVPRYVVILAFVVAILSFLSIPLSSSYAFQPSSNSGFPELRGIYRHQLRLGLLMSVALGLIAIAALNGDIRKVITRHRFLVVLIIAACLIAALARLYTAAALVALIVTIGISKPGLRRIVTVVFAVLLAVGWYFYQGALLDALGGGEFDLTLTGRTLVWERTSVHIENSPWFGFGYASFDHPSFDYLFPYYRPGHPHNSFLQAYFETGLIGLLLTLLLVGAHFSAALTVSRNTRKYSYSLFLVVLTVLGSLTGSNYAGKPTLLFGLLLLTLAIETRIQKQARSIGASNRQSVGVRTMAVR